MFKIKSKVHHHNLQLTAASLSLASKRRLAQMEMSFTPQCQLTIIRQDLHSKAPVTSLHSSCHSAFTFFTSDCPINHDEQLAAPTGWLLSDSWKLSLPHLQVSGLCRQILPLAPSLLTYTISKWNMTYLWKLWNDNDEIVKSEPRSQVGTKGNVTRDNFALQSKAGWTYHHKFGANQTAKGKEKTGDDSMPWI